MNEDDIIGFGKTQYFYQVKFINEETIDLQNDDTNTVDTKLDNSPIQERSPDQSQEYVSDENDENCPEKESEAQFESENEEAPTCSGPSFLVHTNWLLLQ